MPLTGRLLYPTGERPAELGITTGGRPKRLAYAPRRARCAVRTEVRTLYAGAKCVLSCEEGALNGASDFGQTVVDSQTCASGVAPAKRPVGMLLLARMAPTGSEATYVRVGAARRGSCC
jgi:hypothetical protein